jgi:hypothetical protein
MNSQRIASSCLWAAMAVAVTLVPIAAHAQESDDDWQWGVTIYAWLPSLSGDTSFPSVPGDGGSGSIGVSGQDILNALNFTFMSAVDVRKGRWGVATDVIYLDLGDKKSNTRQMTVGGRDLPASVTADLDLNITGWLWTTVGTYRAIDEPGRLLTVFAGARLLDLQETLKWQLSGDIGSLPLPGSSGKSHAGDSVWDGIVGIKGQVRFGAQDKWFVPFYLDIGAGNSDLTWQGMTGIGYSYSWGELVAVWRYLDYDLGSNTPIKSLVLNGPAIGATWRF